MSSKSVQKIDRVVIRFAGDSGDGMQLTGDQFTSDTAAMGNDLSTLPNYPAEIRAPLGTIPGVSSFQVHFADHHVLTPGDAPDVLVAMNPAALKANLKDVPRGGTVLVNTDEFTARNLAKVGYDANPLDDDTLSSWHVHPVALTSITVEALSAFDGLSKKEKERARTCSPSACSPGCTAARPTGTESFLAKKFAYRPRSSRRTSPPSRRGGTTARRPRTSRSPSRWRRPRCRPGTYRNITGNTAMAYGLVAAAYRAGLPLVLGSYPITPASEILHELSQLKRTAS